MTDLDAPQLAQDQTQLADIVNPRCVSKQRSIFKGRVWDLVQEEVSLADGAEPFNRDFLRHPGAVAVAAMNEKQQILLINQYRHPVGASLWEVPAGLLDIAGEAPLEAAARELAEETFLEARRWDTLMEFYNSPGSSAEACRIYLARDFSAIPSSKRQERQQEEAEIVMHWVDIDQAVAAVLAGRIHNAAATNAILALEAARTRNFSTLYPADLPFDAHPLLRDADFRGEINPSTEAGA